MFSLGEIDQENDVLLLDEIQECPESYASLKSFKEQLPRLKVLATGSYLNLFLKTDRITKHPVGCVDECHLYPLSFAEFLENTDENLYGQFHNLNLNDLKLTNSLHEKFITKLNEYFFAGGMPEIVVRYAEEKMNENIRRAIRQKQRLLIKQYILDFQKYGKSVHVKKIDKVFQEIPFQLERAHDDSVTRFAFKSLGMNTNYNKLHWAFDYLEQAGLIHRSYIVSKTSIPFRVHEEIEQRNLFKCYYFDVGLLNAAINTPVNTPLENLGSYKGYLAENVVACEFVKSTGSPLACYRKNSKQDAAEIEFLLTNQQGELIPVEVKSSKKALRSKSLESFVKDFKPRLAYKLVPTRGGPSSGFSSVPLYLAEKIAASVHKI
jgi:predicted AAA+ superfamily ATPase